MIKTVINEGLKKIGYKMVKLSAPVTEFYKESPADQKSRVFSYEEAIQFVVGMHVTTEGHIRTASIPQEALEYVTTYLKKFPKDKPLIALHVGNFVGVSLTWMASELRQIHPESVVVSIDPNISHRDVRYPLEVVIKIANHFSLQNNIMYIVGYSLEKNNSDSGCEERNSLVYPGFEKTLKNLNLFSGEKYDLALIDGNHEGAYLKREVESIYGLLKSSGLLVLDDIDDYWENRAQLKSVYEHADQSKFTKLGADGRVGILMKK